MVFKKTAAQMFFLLIGMAMLIFKGFVGKAQNGNGRLKGASNVG